MEGVGLGIYVADRALYCKSFATVAKQYSEALPFSLRPKAIKAPDSEVPGSQGAEGMQAVNPRCKILQCEC